MPSSIPAHADPQPLWHSLSVTDVLHVQSVDQNRGLTGEDVARRMGQFGPNSLPTPRRRSPWLRLALQFHSPLIYVLLVAGVITLGLRGFLSMPT